ncbi:MAG TPA: histidine phosphatase family protein [Actinomycetes bacterium]
MSSALVFLARHGETEWTVTRRHTGSTDVPLTDAGELQAVELGQLLTGVEPDRVLSSPLRRALDTARLAGFEDQVERVDALREFDYGEYEGLTSDQIRASRPDWDLFRDGCPGGETPEQVAARVKPLLDEIVTAGQRVILFGHGHCLRILAATYLGLPPSDARYLFLDTASLSLLGTEHSWPAIRHWNQVAR